MPACPHRDPIYTVEVFVVEVVALSSLGRVLVVGAERELVDLGAFTQIHALQLSHSIIVNDVN